MSNLPVSDPHTTEDSEFFGPFDPLDHISWSLYHEILQPDGPSDRKNEEANDSRAAMGSSAGVLDDDNGPKQTKIRSKTKKKNSRLEDENGGVDQGGAEEGPSDAKKLDHNAKERIRRMKINASYLALRALLPDSRRSKKRWSAPAVVDKVLKYIPDLENEVQALKSSKEDLHLEAKKKKIAVGTPSSELYQSPTVSVNRVNSDEAIAQICMARDDEVFANMLQNVEDEDICIKSVSSLHVCETRLCYHLHIQIKSRSEAESYIEELRDKVVSWLR